MSAPVIHVRSLDPATGCERIDMLRGGRIDVDQADDDQDQASGVFARAAMPPTDPT